MMNPSPRPGRRGPRLLLALALGAAAAAGVYMYVNSIQQQAQISARTAAQQAAVAATSRSRVVVAKVSLAAGTALSPDNVELRDTPTEAIQPNAINTLDDAVGKALIVPVAAGEQILTHRLGTTPNQPDVKKFADLVPAGKRAMSVTFTELSTAGGLIAPGDHVDVIGVFNASTLGKDQSMLLLQDVLVLAVAQETSADQLPRQGSIAGAPVPQNLPPPSRGGANIPIPQPTSASVPVAPAQTRTVTLAVDPEAAERLALAEDYGHLR
jgi:Flp pilus assembly protein CpaB